MPSAEKAKARSGKVCPRQQPTWSRAHRRAGGYIVLNSVAMSWNAARGGASGGPPPAPRGSARKRPWAPPPAARAANGARPAPHPPPPPDRGGPGPTRRRPRPRHDEHGRDHEQRVAEEVVEGQPQ